MDTSLLSICSDIANIVLAAASVATAIVTAVVLIKQRNDSINEKQPRFYFQTHDRTLYIRTEKDRLLQIKDVSVTHYIEICKAEGISRKIIPIKYSDSVSIKTDSLGQYAAVSIDVISRTTAVKKLTDYLVKSKWDHVYSNVELIRITYIDVYRREQKQYFVNRVLTSNLDYTRYEMWSSHVSSTPIAVKEIDFESILGNTKE